MVAVPVEAVLFDWGVSTRAERSAAKLPVQFSSKVNDRAHQLGDDPRSIRSRIQGDIAMARAQIGMHDFLHWN